jgi:hypothetical protein
VKTICRFVCFLMAFVATASVSATSFPLTVSYHGPDTYEVMSGSGSIEAWYRIRTQSCQQHVSMDNAVLTVAIIPYANIRFSNGSTCWVEGVYRITSVTAGAAYAFLTNLSIFPHYYQDSSDQYLFMTGYGCPASGSAMITVSSSGSTYRSGFPFGDLTFGSGASAQSCALLGIFLKMDFMNYPFNAVFITKTGSGLGTVTSLPGGISCGTDCEEAYPVATDVTLFATPAAGSLFAGWSWACTGMGTCTVAMSATRSVVATFVPVNAGSANANEWVQKSYVAYYGRPADPAGLAYWATRMDNEGGSLASVIQAFGHSPEFDRRYGGLTYSQLIDSLYQQTLGRMPDAPGKLWYLNLLNTGQTTLQTITLDLLGGATGIDVFTVANRLDVANHYTGKVAAGCPYGGELAGVASLTPVTSDPATAWTAKLALEARCGP